MTARGEGRGALAAVACLAAMAAGCRTGLAESDVVARPPDAPFRRVLVVGMDASAELRDRMERELVDELRGKGVEAIASSSYFAFSSEPPSREEVRALVGRERVDGILVARLAPRGTEYRQVPVAGDPFLGPPLGFYDYYWRAWPYVYSPTYLAPITVEAVPVAALEARLYDARGDGRLVFRATSDEFDLEGARRAIGGVSDALAETLARAGLVPGAPKAG